MLTLLGVIDPTRSPRLLKLKLASAIHGRSRGRVCSHWTQPRPCEETHFIHTQRAVGASQVWVDARVSRYSRKKMAHDY
jgi:hypothetical protein